MPKLVEYRIRPITKFIVTRWHDDRDMDTAGSETCGEFPNEEQALTAARGLVALEPGARLIRPTPAGFDADGNKLEGSEDKRTDDERRRALGSSFDGRL